MDPLMVAGIMLGLILLAGLIALAVAGRAGGTGRTTYTAAHTSFTGAAPAANSLGAGIAVGCGLIAASIAAVAVGLVALGLFTRTPGALYESVVNLKDHAVIILNRMGGNNQPFVPPAPINAAPVPSASPAEIARLFDLRFGNYGREAVPPANYLAIQSDGTYTLDGPLSNGERPPIYGTMPQSMVKALRAKGQLLVLPGIDCSEARNPHPSGYVWADQNGHFCACKLWGLR